MEIVDIKGIKHNIDCIACSIQSGKINLPVERIAETKYFVAEQDLEYPIAGFVIIASKRHIKSIDEMSDNELADLGQFTKKMRSAMRGQLDISMTTIIQEENTNTSHFHIWLFPWHAWMLDKWHGKVQEVKEVMDYARKNLKDEPHLNAVNVSVQKLKSE